MLKRVCRPEAAWKALALLAVLLATTVASAQPLSQVRPGAAPGPTFRLIGELLLELDGRIDEQARIYHSPGRSSVLVRSPELGAIELQPATKRVLGYTTEDLSQNGDGSVDIKDTATPKPSGQFRLVDNLPVFAVGERRARLVPKPPTLGPFLARQLVEEIPAYARRAASYQPQTFYLEKLGALEEDLHIKVVFGSWCSVCTQLMPRILRVEAELASTGVTFDYYGIDKGFADPEAKRLNVTSLPTGILFMHGKEIARAAGNGWTFPAKTIYQILISAGILVE